jgi:hypothetical protein
MRRAFKLWWLERSRRKSNKSYSAYVAEAKDEEQQFRISEAINDRDERRDQIQSLRSMLLTDRAEGLGIPIPPLSDTESWEPGRIPGTTHLTLKAQAQLSQSIRNERIENWSVPAFVLKDIVTPLVSLLVGLLGMIMGLFSLIHAFHSKKSRLQSVDLLVGGKPRQSKQPVLRFTASAACREQLHLPSRATFSARRYFLALPLFDTRRLLLIDLRGRLPRSDRPHL